MQNTETQGGKNLTKSRDGDKVCYNKKDVGAERHILLCDAGALQKEAEQKQGLG